MKEYFVLSDIHAQYDLLLKALHEAKFDLDNPEHILIIAGDVLDRGKQGHEVIRYLENLIESERLLGVIGNHDLFLRDIIEGIYSLKSIVWNAYNNGFYQTLLLGADSDDEILTFTKDTLDKVRHNIIQRYPTFCKWVLELPIYLEFPKHVIVHAFIDFSLPDWHDTELRFAVWERRYDEKLPESFEKKLIFGHTPNHYINKQNDIIFRGKRIMIDGGAASAKQINILKLDEETI